jgi:hypothetical protein
MSNWNNDHRPLEQRLMKYNEQFQFSSRLEWQSIFNDNTQVHAMNYSDNAKIFVSILRCRFGMLKKYFEDPKL